MAIKVGDKVPSATLSYLGPDGMTEIKTDDLLKGTVVLFSLPGAFTPTCSAKHVPGFVQHADQIKAKGVNKIVCLAVNDPFVMKAWGEQQKVGDKIFMLPDGSAKLTKEMGMEQDLTARGLGVRSKRFAMILKDGVVKSLFVETAPGVLETSSAENVLKSL
jgi:peroxiredoxin